MGCTDNQEYHRTVRLLFTADKLEAYKDANYLKGGIVFADAVTTVSNTYAEEIKTPFYGENWTV